MDSDYIGQANQYIEDVLADKVPACVYVKQCVERQQQDLLKPPAGYHFDTDRAERVCRFIEKLPHVKGELRGTSIKLEPWQLFILTTCFGWIDKDGYRRFKTMYVEVPRKNAKSTLSSGVALYCLFADGEGGAECYSAATTRDQAAIVFNDAVEMLKLTPDLGEYFNAEIMGKAKPHTIVSTSTNSAFKPLSRDQGGNHDGLNIHCGVIDELHAHKYRDIFDVLETGTGARRQPVLWLISTAGFNRAGICFEQRTYARKILDHTHADEQYFGIIYTIDECDDWTKKESWIKANPNYGISVNPQDIERLALKAENLPSATNNFLTKRLNVWVNAGTAWLDMRKWESCGIDGITPEDFIDEPCWLGLDLASRDDIAALAQLFKRREDDGKIHYYLFGKYWLPENTISNARNSQYSGWASQGIIEATEGNIIDFDFIEDEVNRVAMEFNVVECCYDPYQATQISTHLSEAGLTMVEVGATVANFSEPMKELEALILDGRLHHNNDPCLAWQASNVVAHVDVKENIFPRKELPQNKIDGIIAGIMALNRAMFQGVKVSTYEENELFIL